MGAVGADGELELEEELVGLDALSVIRMPVLAAHLAELAGPVGEDERGALVGERGIVGALRTVEAQRREPALRELVLQGGVSPEGMGLGRVLQVAAAPDQLGAPEEPVIDRAPQGAPAQREVGAYQRGVEALAFVLGRAAGERG